MPGTRNTRATLRRVLNLLLSLTLAVLIGAIALRPDPPTRPSRNMLRLEPLAHDRWDRVRASGHRIGPENADVELVMFTDYECPFCRETEKVVTAVRAAFSDRFAVIYRHYPVRNHMPEAYVKARIAECGAMVDRFLDLQSLLYEGDVDAPDFVQSLVRTTAIESPAFLECAQDTLRVQAIEDDLALIREIGTRRTPSLFLDGHVLSNTPDSAQLHALVQAALASR